MVEVNPLLHSGDAGLEALPKEWLDGGDWRPVLRDCDKLVSPCVCVFVCARVCDGVCVCVCGACGGGAGDSGGGEGWGPSRGGIHRSGPARGAPFGAPPDGLVGHATLRTLPPSLPFGASRR